ncbi:MAG: transposase [Saprospiraceae bacterium]|jgi:hypothetical protein
MEVYIDKLKEFVFNPPHSILPKSAIGKAINYTRQRWEGLTNFMIDGQIEMDINYVENCIRPLALGRKNYLFAGNEEAAANIAVFYSVFNTCRYLDVNVSKYTTWYLQRVNDTKSFFAHNKSTKSKYISYIFHFI